MFDVWFDSNIEKCMTKSCLLIPMVGRDRQLDKEEDISAAGLSPFKSSLYRMLWIAALFSYVGAAMYDVGASWLMTSLSPNPLFVSLITTATALPIFLFALPSGIFSDIFDRRSILLVTCALGAGLTMIKTPIIPTLSGLVPRSELPAALTLSALGGNIARVIGPTVGGLIVAAIAPWAVFFINSAAFVG